MLVFVIVEELGVAASEVGAEQGVVNVNVPTNPFPLFDMSEVKSTVKLFVAFDAENEPGAVEPAHPVLVCSAVADVEDPLYSIKRSQQDSVPRVVKLIVVP